MRPATILQKLRQAINAYLTSSDEKSKGQILFYMNLFLLGASIPFILTAVIQQLYGALAGLLFVDLIIGFGLLLARKSKVHLATHLLLLSMVLAITSTAFYGQGLHDVVITGLPMIVALAGLLHGQNGTLLAALYGTISVLWIYFGEQNGWILTTHPTSTWSKPTILSLFIWATAFLMYLATDSLKQSLDTMRLNALALKKANQDLEDYAAILEKRAQHLLAGAEVARAATSILEPKELAQQVVDMVCQRFGLYYVGLFLVDKSGKWAVLHAATGEAGQQMLKSGHRLRIGSTSMIGWCIANRKARIALDVGKEAVRFNNPLLPLTRSELALPLITHGEVIGALGIQSDKEAAFTEEDIVSFQAMANQLANAIYNARLYNQLQQELKQRRRAEREIRKLNQELEKRVEERTRELQAANQRLTELSRMKDEFLANVSHELRTPITSIMLYHSLIERKPSQASMYLDSLKRETSRLAHLIEDLLYLSRLEQERVIFKPEKVDLNQLVSDYVNDRTPLAQKRNLTIKLEVTPSLPLAYADVQMIGQVASILLTNAMNYTSPNGQILVRTDVLKTASQQWVGFSVEDNGMGLSEEDRQHIFERFYRGTAGRASAAPGTGLGLAIAKEIMDKHKGWIDVYSEGPGKGARFSVWLPIAE
ncbi:MAG: GAF domain-containing sensor histidine kinase [Anaerolineales bacterium]|nr:GAF domain-containing sensor histidine kinase [Anaerolineales bacterium]